VSALADELDGDCDVGCGRFRLRHVDASVGETRVGADMRVSRRPAEPIVVSKYYERRIP